MNPDPTLIGPRAYRRRFIFRVVTDLRTRYRRLSTLLYLAPLLIAVLGAEPAPKKGAPGPKVTVSARLGRTAVWVGDVFPYSIRVIHDRDVEFALDHLKKESLALAPFVVRGIKLEQGDWSPNKRLLDITLQLASYEIGKNDLTIPPIHLYYFVRETGVGRKENQAETIQVPATRVGLRSTLTRGSLRPRDTKAIAEVDFVWITGAFAIGLIGLGFAGVRVTRWAWTLARTPKAKRRPFARRARDRLVQESLTRVRALGAATDEELAGFYREVSMCLRRYLRESLDLEAACLTPAEIERALGQAGANGTLVRQIRDLLERCEAVLYGRDGLSVALEWRDEARSAFENTLMAMRRELAG